MKCSIRKNFLHRGTMPPARLPWAYSMKFHLPRVRSLVGCHRIQLAERLWVKRSQSTQQCPQYFTHLINGLGAYLHEAWEGFFGVLCERSAA